MRFYGAPGCGKNVRTESVQFLTMLTLLVDIFIPLLPFLPLVVYGLGVSAFFGTTMFLSVASDLLSLLTFHIYIFYLLATTLFSWHLALLGALFNLFRGQLSPQCH